MWLSANMFFLVGLVALLGGLFGPILPAMQSTVFGGLMLVCGCVLTIGAKIVDAVRAGKPEPSPLARQLRDANPPASDGSALDRLAGTRLTKI